jgi:hypothetical protein
MPSGAEGSTVLSFFVPFIAVLLLTRGCTQTLRQQPADLQSMLGRRGGVAGWSALHQDGYRC